MFRLYTEPRSSRSRRSRPDLPFIFASFLPFPNLCARRLPDPVGVSKRIWTGAPPLAHSRPRLPFTTRALQQSKIRAKITLCFHALTNAIFTNPFPLLWLQIRGGCVFLKLFALSRASPFRDTQQRPQLLFIQAFTSQFPGYWGWGSAAPRQASTSLALLTTHNSLLTNSLQYPRPPFVYSIGWTSR
jgi:hypothetical protein